MPLPEDGANGSVGDYFGFLRPIHVPASPFLFYHKFYTKKEDSGKILIEEQPLRNFRRTL